MVDRLLDQPVSMDPNLRMLFLLAEQDQQAIALFDRHLLPIYLNPTAIGLLALSGADNPLASLSLFHARLVGEDGQSQVSRAALYRVDQWRGAVQISRDDVPEWRLCVDGRVARITDGKRTVGFAIIVRRMASAGEAVTAKLTRREADVLDALMTGASNKTIARQLSISHRTVEAHRGHIMRKLDAHSIPDLFKRVLNDRRA